MIYSERSLENTEDKENTKNKKIFNMIYGFWTQTLWIPQFDLSHLKTSILNIKKNKKLKQKRPDIPIC